MLSEIICFLVGLMVGGGAGFIAAALCFIARDTDNDPTAP